MKKIIIILGAIFWPLSLFLTNQPQFFLNYTISAALLIIFFLISIKKGRVFLFPILIIPFIDVKLTLLLFTIFAGLIATKIKIPNYHKIIYFTFSIIIFTTVHQAFLQQSIFKYDYEKRQEVLREIHFYPNPTMARIYQNKARIITDKFTDNFLALIDPGNYFFSFHPREDVLINQNIIKYPFIAIIPVLLGFLEIRKLKQWKFILSTFIAGVFALSFLEIFDGSDFILWLPLTLVFVHGIDIIYKSKNKNLHKFFLYIFILNCLIEFTRIFYIY